MPMNANSIRALVEPMYVTVFDGRYDRQDDEWNKLFEVEKAEPRRWQEDVSIAGLGPAHETQEGDGPVYDEGREAYRVRYLHREYSLAFAVTRVMLEDSEHISIGKTFSLHLADSMKETKELVHANIINNAFNPAQAGGDGVAMIASNHPLANGGTASNYFGAIDLSEASLEQARASIRVAVNERGLRINLKPRKLVVSTLLFPNANRILKSTKRAGTADNDINFVSGLFPEGIMEYTRLTNPYQWMIITNAPRGLRHLWRRKITRGTESDFNTGNTRFIAHERYAAYWTDWRGIWGSDGQ